MSPFLYILYDLRDLLVEIVNQLWLEAPWWLN